MKTKHVMRWRVIIISGVLLSLLLEATSLFYFTRNKGGEIAEGKTLESPKILKESPVHMLGWQAFVAVERAEVVSAVPGDFDNDGDIDLAVFTIDKASVDWQKDCVVLYVFTNDGKGNFTKK